MVEKYNKDGSISLNWLAVEVTKIKENKAEPQIPVEKFAEMGGYVNSVLIALDKLKKDDLAAFNKLLKIKQPEKKEQKLHEVPIVPKPDRFPSKKKKYNF